MKIRNGFVSNSSSSSYIVIADKKATDEIKNNLDPIELAILDVLYESSKILGIDCYSFSWMDGEAGEYMSDVADNVMERAKEIYEEKGLEWDGDDFFYDNFWDALDNWYIKLPKDKRFYHSDYF